MKEDSKEIIFISRVILAFILALILFGMCSCGTTKYIEKEVPVEVIKTEYKNVIVRDSTYVHDSIFMTTRNDTVFRDRFRTVYKDKLKVDTILRVDSIDKPIYIRTTEVKEVNKLNLIQTVLCYIGLIALVFVFVRIYLKFKK